MSIDIPRKLERQIEHLLNSGKYEDSVDVLSKAVDLLTETDMQESLDALLAVGREQTERGELIDYSPEIRVQIRSSAHRRFLAEGAAPTNDGA